MSVRLHIERLVLDGLPLSRAQGAQVKAAIEAELGRLFMDSGIAPELRSGVALPRIDAGPVHAPRGASPAALGTQIARGIFAGVGRR